MTTTHATLRAFRLPDGRWSLQHGYRLSERAATYKERGYPCFYFRDGILLAVTPTTIQVGQQVPALMPELLDLLAEREITLAPNVARWLRKLARFADQYGYPWRCLPYRHKSRRIRANKAPDFISYVTLGHFSTGPIRTQADFLGGMHEIGHLRLGATSPLNQMLQVEAGAWDWAYAHAGEQITPASYGDAIRCYRTYLRYYRYYNRRRASGPRPVPQAARHFVAVYRRYETRPYPLRITDLANSSTHESFEA